MTTPDARHDVSGIVNSERYSDAGNAKRLVRLFGDSIRYVPEVGWFVFDGARWKRDEDGELVRMAKSVPQAIIDGSRDFPKDAREEAVRFALRSESAPRLAAMVELAKSEPGITIPYHTLDADPWIVGVPGGAIDLRTRGFVVPSRRAYLSRHLGVEFNPHAKAPIWCAFLDRVMAGDVTLIDFLQRAVGYTLTGDTSEQCMFILHGPGANGKSVFLRVLRLCGFQKF
jgi:putative DNA primase/helicase